MKQRLQKKLAVAGSLLGCLAIGVQIQTVVSATETEPAGTESSKYSVVQRSAHSRTWERVEYETTLSGQQIPRVHRYTELATGMHFTNAAGVWVESKEEIQILPNGAGAKSDQGRHKVTFPPNLYDGMIELNTPDNKWLRSRVLGLSYFDFASRKSVLIAETKSSVGELHASNVVIYPDAFKGFQADVRCTYTRAAFEQDIILREQPPSPKEYGLNPETARLQVLTEFFDPPVPNKHVLEAGGLRDETLDFGVMKIGPGKAFVLGEEETRRSSEQVIKTWDKLEGRDFLIEEVEYKKIEPKLQALPVASVAAIYKQVLSNDVLNRVVSGRVLPVFRLAKQSTNTFQIAKASASTRPGYVLDYTIIEFGSETDYTLAVGQTYLIGVLNISGTLTIQSGAVIKFYHDPAAGVFIYDSSTPVVCQTTAQSPAFFTAMEDSSIGEPIEGAQWWEGFSGQCQYGCGCYGYALSFNSCSPSSPPVLEHLRFRYGDYGISGVYGSELNGAVVRDCQFVDMAHPLAYMNSCTVQNVLINRAGEFFMASTINATNLTIHTAYAPGWNSTMHAVNSLFVGVDNLESYTGDHNAVLSSDEGVFQSGPLGDHYLASGSPCIDGGNTTADVIGLYHDTTQTNQVKETNSTVDIGYHYLALNPQFSTPYDTDGDGFGDYFEDRNGNGVYDAGDLSDFKSTDTDSDGLTDMEEVRLGYDPKDSHTGGTVASDADKDSDGDLLSNVAELRVYRSDPTKAHTYNQEKSDAEYFHTAELEANNTLARLHGPTFPSSSLIRFTISDAQPGDVYDLYIAPSITPPIQWKRYYSGSPGQTELICPMPAGSVNFFEIGSAADSDGDGLTDGYEVLISKTILNNRRTDLDDMPDGWEVEYALNPLSDSGDDGDNGNQDNDFRPPPNQTQPLTNLLEWNNGVSSTDPKRNNVSQQQRAVVSITVTDPTASEGGGDTAKFRVTRPGTSGDLVVHYVLGGTATVGPDYTLNPSPSESYPGYTVTIFDQYDHADLEINPASDLLAEGTETVIVGLAPDPTDQYVVATHPHRATATVSDCNDVFTYTSDEDFDLGLALGVNHDVVHGQLQMNGATATFPLPQFPYLGVACSGRGTIVRINVTNEANVGGETVIGKIVGEYRTSPTGRLHDPSRTTVDQFGNIWVANRAENGAVDGDPNGSITRIGLIIGGTPCNADGSETGGDLQYLKPPFDYSTCIDRDGDGLIKTSKGLANILPWNNLGGADDEGGVSTADDEAIINYVRVKPTGTRTIAVDRRSDIWVGGHDSPNAQWHQKVDGATGQIIPGTAFNLGCGGYGGLIDPNGVLWSARSGSGLLRFDPNSPPVPENCVGSDCGDYGLGIDPQTGIIWHTYRLVGGTVYTWSPSGSCLGLRQTGASRQHKGVVVDDNSNVWLASVEEGSEVTHIRTDGTIIGNVDTVWNGQPHYGPLGVAVDSVGKIWAACFDGNSVMRIDPDAGPIVNGYHKGAIVSPPLDLGDGTGHLPPYNVEANPYNYSDMTGFVTRHLTPTGGLLLRGTWTVVQDCGIFDATWSVSWAENKPAGTYIRVYIRAADNRTAIFRQHYQEVQNGESLSSVHGRYLQVLVALSRDSGTTATPVFDELTLSACSAPITIITPPANQAVCEGDSAQFSVTVSGTSPFTYQWLFNGSPISGANGSSLTVPDVQAANLGRYSVIVTDANGVSVTSPDAILSFFINIPLDYPAYPYPAILNLSGKPASPSKVTVTLRLTHEMPENIDMLLVGPTGRAVWLMSDAGDYSPVSGVTVTFDDTVSNPLPEWDEITTGTYETANYDHGDTEIIPEGTLYPDLSAFNGQNPNGTWKLYVVDDVPSYGVGSICNVTINVFP